MARTKSTARAWKSAPGPNQAFRDNETIRIDGQPVRLWGYGPTKAKATADLRRKVAERRAAAAAAGTSPTVTTVFAGMLRFKRNLKGRKHGTIHGYLDLYKRHIRPFIGESPLEDVTLEDLQAIQSRLATAGKWRTAEMATIMLKSIWKHYGKQVRARARQGKTPFYDVAADLEQVQRPPEAVKGEKQTWSTDQLAAFLAEAKRVYDTRPISLIYPVFHTAIAAGLRRGELLGLRRSDLEVVLDADGNPWHQLVIRGQYTYYGGKHRKATPKSPSGVRRVPIGPELVDVLKAHMARVDKVAKHARDAGLPWKDHGLMFSSYRGGPIEPSHLYRARDEIIKAVNAERPRFLTSVTLHELRSVYITYITRELVRQGRYSPKLVMFLAGHSHPNVALEHYNRVIEEDLAAATFEPLTQAISGKSRGKPSNEKDADSAESAS